MANEPQRNHQISVVADKDAACWWRDWLPGLYPAGARHIRLMIQADNGWVELKPDPNHGLTAHHSTRPHIQTGQWLRGPRSPSSASRDVALARLFLGHRFWHVSTYRVWAYRAVAMAALAFFLWPTGYAWASLLVLLIKSPCTPRGVILWCDRLGFGNQALKMNKITDDEDGAAILARVTRAPGSST